MLTKKVCKCGGQKHFYAERCLRCKRQSFADRTEKYCRRCDTVKPIVDFSCRSKLNRTMRSSWCAKCINSFKAKRREERKKIGLCDCGRTPEEGNQLCAHCLATAKRCRAKQKDLVFNTYGGYLCVCCGETEKSVLQLDHINNDGWKHRRSFGANGSYAGQMYKWIIKNNFPKLFQVLCVSCNWEKRIFSHCRRQSLCHKVHHK